MPLRLEKIVRRMDKIQIVFALNKVWVHKNSVDVLELDEGAVSNHRRRYEKRGLGDFFNDDHKGWKPSPPLGDLQRLSTDLQKRIFLSVKTATPHAQKEFGAKYSRSRMTNLLRRFSFSFSKATSGISYDGWTKKRVQFDVKINFGWRKLNVGAGPFCLSGHPTRTRWRGCGSS